MLKPNDFYERYDELIPLLCEGYWDFLKIGALAIPEDARSICDLGIGTGNFSLAVKRRFSEIALYGVDFNCNFVKEAERKLGNITIARGDIFGRAEIPEADYMISSLTLHHLPDEKRRECLLNIAEAGKGFINFDLALSKGRTKEEAINRVIAFARRSFPDRESLENIAEEMRNKDNPMHLDEQRQIYEGAGFKFSLIEERFPYAAYYVFRQ